MQKEKECKMPVNNTIPLSERKKEEEEEKFVRSEIEWEMNSLIFSKNDVQLSLHPLDNDHFELWEQVIHSFNFLFDFIQEHETGEVDDACSTCGEHEGCNQFDHTIYAGPLINSVFSIEYEADRRLLQISLKNVAGSFNMAIDLNDQKTWDNLVTAIKEMKNDFRKCKTERDCKLFLSSQPYKKSFKELVSLAEEKCCYHRSVESILSDLRGGQHCGDCQDCQDESDGE
jgi:hypothetical protein